MGVGKSLIFYFLGVFAYLINKLSRLKKVTLQDWDMRGLSPAYESDIVLMPFVICGLPSKLGSFSSRDFTNGLRVIFNNMPVAPS